MSQLTAREVNQVAPATDLMLPGCVSTANTSPSSKQPNWSRETPSGPFDAPRQALRFLRRYQRMKKSATILRRLRLAYYKLGFRIWSAQAGMEIPLDGKIAGGLLLPHANGIVIHPRAVIGPNCLIFQQVTIGEGGSQAGVPTIGGHVDIGAGARVLGGITVGNHSRIGANAVVLSDIPDGATAVGVPARVIERKSPRKDN